MEPNFPIMNDNAADAQNSPAKSSTRKTPLYKPLPLENKQKADNRIIVTLFDYRNFKYFKDWNFQNYYLRVYAHVVDMMNENGSTYKAFVLCPREMNRFTKRLSQTSEVPNMFDSDDCAFCKHSQDLWGQYEEEKKTAGIFNMTTEEFIAAMENNPGIQETRNAARAWGSIERFYYVVYDYDKHTGKRALADEESRPTVQGFWGPAKLAEKLDRKRAAGNRFWDFENGNARIVTIAKDTHPTVQRCKYEFDTEERPPTLDGDLIAYLSGAEAPDPSNDVLKWNQEEMTAYLDKFRDIPEEEPRTEPVEEKPVPATTPTEVIPDVAASVSGTSGVTISQPTGLGPNPVFPPPLGTTTSQPKAPLATAASPTKKTRHSW